MSSENGGKSTDVINSKEAATCLEKWENITERMRRPLLNVLVAMARFSAKKPTLTIISTIFVSFFLIIVGFRTNFYLETNNAVLWSPSGSYTSMHREWVSSGDSGFEERIRRIVGIIHKQGEDVSTLDAMEKMFKVVDVVKSTEGYHELCGEKNSDMCGITAPTGFWNNHSYSLYKSDVSSDGDVKEALSSFLFANGKFVNRDLIVGLPEPDVNFDEMQEFVKREQAKLIIKYPELLNGDISEIDKEEFLAEGLKKAAIEYEFTFVKSLVFSFDIPNTDEYVEQSEKLEREAVKRLLALSDDWETFFIASNSRSSAEDELIRGIIKDIPLMIGAFFIMTLFCSYSLSKDHRVESQGILGFGAVFTIGMSLLSGYGLLFLIGVPLSSIAYLFPYAMLGFGLDDTFILTGAFSRTDPEKDVVERVVETIEEVGMSITVSTLTTVVAYFLGSSSQMPGVKWFCLYASTIIIIDFIYQITFFIAILSLDDRRIKSNRLDFLVCFKSTKYSENSNINTAIEEEERQAKLLSNRIMSNYSKMLLKPGAKIFVLVLFAAMFAGLTYIAYGVTEGLDGRDLLPTDSYVREYFDDLEMYTSGAQEIFSFTGVYFRDVDVSDENVQRQMLDYVDELVDTPYITNPPLTFWLRDFQGYLQLNETLRDDQSITFNEKLDLFLQTPPYNDLYIRDIARLPNGTVVASRTNLFYDQVSLYDTNQQVAAFKAQREVTLRQPLNENSLDGNFFTFADLYFGWELWVILTKEIVITVALGLVSLFIISLIFVPHPIAAFILTPTVFSIFVEVIAVLRMAGLQINALSSIGLITCLGLVMDYNLHVCITYFEVEGCTTRNEKVEKVLKTMGKSIMKGGFTTFLGVLPLSLNSSLGFRTLFVTFIGITSLGVAHGLIFLPVILSLIGPLGNGAQTGNSKSVEAPKEAVIDKVPSTESSLPSSEDDNLVAGKADVTDEVSSAHSDAFIN